MMLSSVTKTTKKLWETKMQKFNNLGLWKNASPTISIYGKTQVIHFPYDSTRTENCMKGLWLVFFFYMETVRLAFFHKPKIMIFFILISQNCSVVFVTEHKWHKLWLLKRSDQRFGSLALKMLGKQPSIS